MLATCPGIQHVERLPRDAEPAGPADKSQLVEGFHVAESNDDSTPWRNGTVSIAPTTRWPPVVVHDWRDDRTRDHRVSDVERDHLTGEH